MLRLDRFAGIPEFMATAQAGSFTAAGASLGLTKSAVSKIVARLEARLGARLFHRTTRRLSLTADGEAFLATCAIATDEIEGFEELLGAGRETPTGRVRIDLPGAFGRIHIIPVLTELMAMHPQLAISASFTDRRIDLIEDGVDIAVRIGPAPDSTDLVARQIGLQTLVICASPDYLARHGAPEDRSDLAQHHLIVGRRNRTRHAWLFRCPDGTSERAPVSGFHELEDGEAMLSAAVAGLGIAQLPTWLAHKQFESGALVPVLEHLSGGQVPISLIWVGHPAQPLRIRAVLDTITRDLNRWSDLPSPVAINK